MKIDHDKSNRKAKASKLDYRDTDEFLYPEDRQGKLAIFHFRERDLRTDIHSWPIERTLDPTHIGRALPIALKHPDVFDRLYQFKGTDRISVTPIEESAIGLIWEFRHAESYSARLMHCVREWQTINKSPSKHSATVSGLHLAFGIAGNLLNIISVNRSNKIPDKVIQEYNDSMTPADMAVRALSHYFRMRCYLEDFLELYPESKTKKKKKRRKKKPNKPASPAAGNVSI